MIDAAGHPLNEKYTSLSDRFRSLWTFYQFLGGVFKHLGRGAVPASHDFQRLHKRLQDSLPQPGFEDITSSGRELDLIGHELQKIHAGLAEIEEEFPPSLLRRFFDHLKRQDQKILFALAKFYLMSADLSDDDIDKLDILLTRLSEAPSVDDRGVRDLSEMQTKFERLAEFAGIVPLAESDEEAIIEMLRALRNELASIEDFNTLMQSGILDRYRQYKHQLGKLFLHPPVLLQIIATNSEAKASFSRLYEDEETRILEDTNRILEIERHVERNPDMAHPELLEQLATFKKYRDQFDSGRKVDNVKGIDVVELRQTMMRVIEAFDTSVAGDREPFADTPSSPTPIPARSQPERGGFFDQPTDLLAAVDVPSAVDLGLPEASEPGAHPEVLSEELDESGFPDAAEISEARYTDEDDYPVDTLSEIEEEAPSLVELVKPEQAIVDALQKIAFTIEMVAWDYTPEQAVSSRELNHLNLETWEFSAFRRIMAGELVEDTRPWQLERFFLISAALRVKIEEEIEEIQRLNQSGESERLRQLVGQAAQSLELASRYEHRFQWFIEDILFNQESERLEQIHCSRFRFLQVYAQLWLEHWSHGGYPELARLLDQTG
jgi:hypothetical protein